jgi:hypothetical protein
VSREHIAEADGDAGEELLKRFVLKHKSHCRGKLMVAQHLDGADWFAYAYACTQCNNTVRDGHPSQLCGKHRSHASTRPTDAVESGQNTSASRAMGERSGSQ